MPRKPTRRTFLKLSAAAASLATAQLAHAATDHVGVTLVFDPESPLAKTESFQWSFARLSEVLQSKGLLAKSPGLLLPIVIAEAADSTARTIHPAAQHLTHPETLALIPGHWVNTAVVLVTGSDTRGIVYAILELADRIRSSDDPIAALHLAAPIIETSPNKVRSVARAFVSETEDKAWFYDRAFWTRYLDTLAAARFNRFAFTLGIGYDFPRGVTGDYLHFPYPYLVEVPGYEQVHVEPPLAAGERQLNLETLQFIAAETARRGLDFQLGIWTHAYQWTDSPHSDHQITGLTPATHATYCRDALAALLRACPQISGLTLRIHGESGIPEGSYPFWTTLFEAIKNAGRTIEIDMHAKGLNQEMIDIAHATGMPVKAGAKFWAEHLGLGYQQTDIRAAEYPREGVTGTFAVSSGARNFTRYGYGDFYQYPQGAPAGTNAKGVDLLYRVWPGTQRHLLWGDPALAAGYGRAANFCGAAGLELMEPLFFKGREGSGHPGGRNAYSDEMLDYDGKTLIAIPSPLASAFPKMPEPLPPFTPPPPLAVLDTEKFTLTYMLWGRYLYNPDTHPQFHHRYLKQAFGPAGPALEVALANSSRILPLVTTAWCPSASNHEFWPEMLTPVSLLPYTGKPLYGDSPAPHNVSAISPLDPQLFTTIDQHAQNLISGKPDARYNTSEVIAWLEAMVATSTTSLAAARATAGTKNRTPEFRRAEEDILILNGLGTYYASLFRAALYFSVHSQTFDDEHQRQCLASYRAAKQAWTDFATRAKLIYTPDVSYGSTPFRRGHWIDRLAMFDDITALENHLTHQYSADSYMEDTPEIMNRHVTHPPQRLIIAVKHDAPNSFHPGADLWLTIATPRPLYSDPILWYRHVTHGERWLSTLMDEHPGTYTAAIPAAYTASPYPLQYYFELRTANSATLHPPLGPALNNQPYFTIYKRT